ncbi:hypothetical protein AAVH_28937 [Aphelenchoides avenae]|nr:hypothetical protein AAVH_28937 [Aphelenchus avenae]
MVQILLANAGVFYVLNAVTICSVALITQVCSLLSLEPCSYVWPVWECVALRFASNAGVLGFMFTHFAILIERTAASLLPHYEKRGPALSLTLVPLLWCAVVGTMVFVMFEERTDLQGYRINCTVYLPATIERLSQVTIVLIALSASSVVGDLVLYIVNNVKLAKRKRLIVDYTLAKSYQISENALTIRIILPTSTLHAALYATYFVLSKLIREPFRQYTDKNIAGAVVEGFTSQLKLNIVESSRETETYFELLKKQIDGNYSKNHA